MWNCLIEYCGGGAVGGPAGVHGGWRHVLIQNCELSHSGHYFQGGDGSTRPYDRPDGFGIEPSAGPVEISHTIVRHNRGDGLDSKAANTYIHNCIVANNSCDGIKLWGTGSKVENCLVYGTGDGEQGRSAWSGIVIHNEEQDNAQFELLNVTLHDDPRHENYQMYVQYGIARPLRLIVRNCVFGGGYGAVHFGETVRLTAEHNLFHRAGGETPVHVGEREYTAAEIERGALGPGNLSRDPQFRRPAWGREGDYRLQPGSPCIDAGTSRQAPAADLDGTSRPRGRAVDLGCYEFQKSPG
jgi:parallel beta-helix repeat protein